jgi:hypothetical protein
VKKLASILLAVIVLIGCTSYTPLPSIDNSPVRQVIICLNADIAFGQELWVREASSRYERFLLLMVHGETLNDEWYAFPDYGPPVPVEQVIERLRKHYRRTRIVAIVCNPNGHVLDSPGVTYADQNVWVEPDRFVGQVYNLLRDHPQNGIGNIYEFEENGWGPDEAMRGERF